MGALLLARLSGASISRAFDQPLPPAGSPPGTGGGYFFSFSLPGLEVEQRWQAIDSVVL